ncbi:MAG: DUF5018 domain-containing protein [Candidatus Staskawiczbacteria bacterium]|jgi:hypothetical protein
MDKITLFLILAIIVSLTILGVAGEYYVYQYSVFSAQQVAQQSPQTSLNTSATPTASPTNQPASGSSENSITAFSFQDPLAVGTINETNHTVTLTVPPDTDVTRLTPTIGISQDATIVPSLGSEQDFTNPVTYTVTAQNGSAQKYTVTVNVASVLKSTGKLITAFTLSGFNPEVDGYIDNNNYTVTAVVPDGTDLTRLTPIISVSSGATISPNSAVAQDFTNPVTYTVTDVYGDTQIYTVTVVTESNSG